MGEVEVSAVFKEEDAEALAGITDAEKLVGSEFQFNREHLPYSCLRQDAAGFPLPSVHQFDEKQ